MRFISFYIRAFYRIKHLSPTAESVKIGDLGGYALGDNNEDAISMFAEISNQ